MAPPCRHQVAIMLLDMQGVPGGHARGPRGACKGSQGGMQGVPGGHARGPSVPLPICIIKSSTRNRNVTLALKCMAQ